MVDTGGLFPLGVLGRRDYPVCIAHPIVTLPRQWEPTPRPPEEDNLPFDPSAFWLYPDWDSGPVTEPFWMRPLKEPPAPMIYDYTRAMYVELRQ